MHPEIIAEILSGKFLTAECPFCGTTLKPELLVSFADPHKELDILLIPEKERNKYLLHPAAYGNHSRVAIGFQELIEKIRAYQANLDDRVIELIKYLLYKKAGGGISVTVKFGGVEDQELLFEIHGLRDEEIGVVRISKNFYDRMARELPQKEKEEPFDVILAPPYVSLSKVVLEGI